MPETEINLSCICKIGTVNGIQINTFYTQAVVIMQPENSNFQLTTNKLIVSHFKHSTICLRSNKASILQKGKGGAW